MIKLTYWSAFLLILVHLIGLPVLFVVVSKETQNSLKEYLAMKLKVEELIDKKESEDLSVSKVFRFVADSIKHPSINEKAGPKSAYEVLQTRSGSCDQQVLLLNQLLNVLNIQARMVFLFNEDSVSHHTVSEINLDGRWSMFDPYFNRYFENSLKGQYFSVAQLMDRSEEFHSIIIRDDYAKYFNNKFPPVVHQTNQPKGKFKWYLKWIDAYSYFPGKYFLMLIQ